MRKALLIGTVSQINDYMNSISYFLNTSRNYNHIMIITCETLQKPNRGVIMALIKQLLYENQPGDELWFHYIGISNEINDVAIWPMDYDKNGFITDNDLRRELIDKVRLGVSLYVILDSIHSGTGFELRYTYNDNSQYIKTDTNINRYNFKDWQLIQSVSEKKQYNKPLGNIFILSCYQQVDDKNIQLGGLTYCLIKVLKNNYGNIKWKYLLKDIKCLLNIKGYNQIPQLSTGTSISMDAFIFTNHSMVFC